MNPISSLISGISARTAPSNFFRPKKVSDKEDSENTLPDLGTRKIDPETTTGTHLAHALMNPVDVRDKKKEPYFVYQVVTDPVNDEPGLMVEVFLEEGGPQVAEIYCETGTVKADIYNMGNDAGASIDPDVLQRSVSVAKSILKGFIDEDRERDEAVNNNRAPTSE